MILKKGEFSVAGGHWCFVEPNSLANIDFSQPLPSIKLHCKLHACQLATDVYIILLVTVLATDVSKYSVTNASCQQKMADQVYPS